MSVKILRYLLASAAIIVCLLIMYVRPLEIEL